MKFSILIFLLSYVSTLHAQTLREKAGEITVYGKKKSLKKITGTRYQIDFSKKASFTDTDPHRAIQEAPGAYIQEEDGFGLRPNIGIRGTHPHRSKKITLLEDGILLSPAPYSAPAAYYFPQMTKLVGVDLIKGATSSLYGPTSIGGVLNFKTREISNKFESQITGVGGAFDYRAYSGHIAQKFGNLKLLFEGGYLESTGFKTLPNQQNTGFEKWDALIKAEYALSSKAKFKIKAGRSNEVSRETYLGLAQDDFSEDPFQRYAASSLDQFDWDQEQIVLGYEFKRSKKSKFQLDVYRQNFRRDWEKFEGFTGRTAPLAQDILNSPVGRNRAFYRVLTGESDSDIDFDSTNPQDSPSALNLTSNDREYYSEGVQASLTYQSKWGVLGKLKHLTGFKIHRDGVERNHTSDFYEMFEGSLARLEDFETQTNRLNQEESQVLGMFHQTTYLKGAWTIDMGFRFERVSQQGVDTTQERTSNEKEQDLFAPGIGISYAISGTSALFSGVHRGIGAAGPGASEGARPEESINYEMGWRSVNRNAQIEVASFLTDYENIKGFCSASSGCESARIDEEFSGGRALVYGIEASMKTEIPMGSVRLPLRFSYTLTQGEFQDSFESGAPNEWGQGRVDQGDPLPYVPERQASVTSGFRLGKLLGQTRWSYRSRVFDQAVSEGRQTISSYQVLDASLTYYLNRNTRFFVSADNVLGEEYAVSLRPFGLRPGKPRQYKAGINMVF